jgi:hypothetical protein
MSLASFLFGGEGVLGQAGRGELTLRTNEKDTEGAEKTQKARRLGMECLVRGNY